MVNEPGLQPDCEQPQAKHQADQGHDYGQRAHGRVGAGMGFAADGTDGGNYVSIVRQRVERAG